MDKLFDSIDAVFNVPRPARFVSDPTHCSECQEYEAALSKLTPATLNLNNTGRPGDEPFAFASNEAFAYFVPGLARLAWKEPNYIESFLDLLSSVNRSAYFVPEQKLALMDFCEALQIKTHMHRELFEDAIRILNTY